MGKSQFLDLSDVSGRLQVYLNLKELPLEQAGIFQLLDIGDFLGVEGECFVTKSGEPTIRVDLFQILSKTLRPLPDKWHGVSDIEIRNRQRYLDLIANPAAREPFVLRSRMIREIRQYLDERGFLEVETPMMQPVAGGSAAQPFKTHHKALDMNLFLRIAPELYLKRLTVGGFDRVYEINRNFRNEGIGWRWNPEFTMLEAYQAYTDYLGIMDTTQASIEQAVLDVTGRSKTKWGEQEIDWSHANWRRMTMREAIVHFWPEKAGARPERSDFAGRESVAALVERVRGAEVSLSYDAAAPVGKT